MQCMSRWENFVFILEWPSLWGIICNSRTLFFTDLTSDQQEKSDQNRTFDHKFSSAVRKNFLLTQENPEFFFVELEINFRSWLDYSLEPVQRTRKYKNLVPASASASASRSKKKERQREKHLVPTNLPKLHSTPLRQGSLLNISWSL